MPGINIYRAGKKARRGRKKVFSLHRRVWGLSAKTVGESRLEYLREVDKGLRGSGLAWSGEHWLLPCGDEVKGAAEGDVEALLTTKPLRFNLASLPVVPGPMIAALAFRRSLLLKADEWVFHGELGCLV